MTRDNVLVDSYGRRVTTLRISLTDHCNFRCVYCMPPEGLSHLEKTQYLTVEEIVRFTRVVGRLGVSRIRLTGGEPLLRKDIVDIVGAVKAIDTVDELSITTNGSRLTELAAPLRAAGLDRMNISLDSLDAERFADITRCSQYESVRAGIEAARAAGYPLKLNVVVLKGMPEAEILDFAQMAVAHRMDVRFLEFMPLCGSGWQADLVYPIAEVREIIRRHFELIEEPRGDRPAETFHIQGTSGKIGFIASLSEPFCDTCARMRLTADGKIRPCLFSDYEVSVGDLLRNGASDDRIAESVRFAVSNKPWGSEFAEKPFKNGDEPGRQVSLGPFIRSIGG